MRRATTATMDNGLPVQCLSERDFLFPDADEKYVPEVLAYIQSYDFATFNTLLWTKMPAAADFMTTKPAAAGGRDQRGGFGGLIVTKVS